MWKLNLEKGESNPIWDYKLKNVNFTCVQSFKPEGSKDPCVYATGTDKSIRELGKDGDEGFRYEQSVTLNQIAIMHNRRAFFTGVAEQKKPGSIQVLRHPFDKMFEIQAHALPVERLRVSYDNQTLYSSAMDGTLAVFAIQEKDQKKPNRDLPSILPSPEILIKKKQRDVLQADIRQLKDSIRTEKRNAAEALEAKRQRFQKRSEDLMREIEERKQDGKDRMEKIDAATRDMERKYQEDIMMMMDNHRNELDRRMQDQAEKIEADHNRYMELKAQKEHDLNKFEMLMSEIYLKHETLMEDMHRDQQLEKDELEAQKKKLSAEIEEMIATHRDKREEVENNTWEQIEMIKEKNKEELISEIDIGMKYKSDLTLIQNEFRVKKAEKTTLDQQKNELQEFLNKQVADTNIKKLQIESQMGELKERQTTIADKEQKIDELRKRTQELEKFKFVLDYKIKELKHKIGPRERKIQVLNEQKTKMQNEVKHFEVVNRNLQLIVQDLKDKLEGLQQEQKSI